MANKSKSETPQGEQSDLPVVGYEETYAEHTSEFEAFVPDDAAHTPNGTPPPDDAVSLEGLNSIQEALQFVNELQPRYVPEPESVYTPPQVTATTEFVAVMPAAPVAPTHAVVNDPNDEIEVQAQTRALPSVEEYTLKPSGTWPPPIYIRTEANEQERFYLEWRWHGQWAWYDKRATEAKKMYQRLQIIIGVGSVSVPVLVGFNPPEEWRFPLTVFTVGISLAVAISAALENVMKHGENWRNFRAAAEELTREKAMYDMSAGPYRRARNRFSVFIERCEEIIAKQNGNWLQLQQNTENTEQQDGTKKPAKPMPFDFTAAAASAGVPVPSAPIYGDYDVPADMYSTGAVSLYDPNTSAVTPPAQVNVSSQYNSDGSVG